MLGIVADFQEFLKKYQVLGLAVAFIIGAASTKLVTALVTDIVMPLVSLIIPGGDWRATTVPLGNSKLLVGDFLGALIDFVIVALVVFLMVKMLLKEDPKQKR